MRKLHLMTCQAMKSVTLGKHKQDFIACRLGPVSRAVSHQDEILCLWHIPNPLGSRIIAGRLDYRLSLFQCKKLCKPWWMELINIFRLTMNIKNSSYLKNDMSNSLNLSRMDSGSEILSLASVHPMLRFTHWCELCMGTLTALGSFSSIDPYVLFGQLSVYQRSLLQLV